MTVAISELIEVDLDTLEGLDEEGLRRHFRKLAAEASAGQLRQVLYTEVEGVSDDEDERLKLVESFVTRRVTSALKLRRLRTEWDPV